MKTQFLAFIILSLLCKGIQAQCTIKCDNYTCLGSSMVFALDAGGQTISSYDWDFGDGQKSNLSSPANLYINAGTYTVKVKANIQGGGSCTDSKTIHVYHLPVAKFDIDPASQYCYIGNNICLIDKSTEGADKNPLTKRIILWGDGAANIDTGKQLKTQSLCHNYNQLGDFVIDMEITDNKGCSGKYAYTVHIKNDLVAKILPDTIDKNCDSPRICFVDVSVAQTGSRIVKSIWKSGNTVDSGTSFCKTFYVGKPESVILYSFNDSGCVDTAVQYINIQPLIVTYKIKDSVVDGCFSSNEVWVSIPPYNSSLKSYNNIFYDENHKPLSPAIDQVSGNSSWDIYSIPRKFGAGKYYISQTLNFGFCDKVYIDSFEINGPFLNDSTIKFRNINQCKVGNDSVYVCINLTKAKAKNCLVTIDFDDNNCPTCTTWKAKSINPNTNCRYSHDPICAHLYTKEGCYQISVTIEDTIRHCTDFYKQYVWIGPPTLQPFYYTGNNFCQGTVFTFHIDKMKPSLPCAFSNWLINFDSACDINNFVARDSAQRDGAGNPEKKYTFTCDPDGWVTVGFIGKTGGGKRYTGCDQVNGTLDECIDTIWMHNWFKVYYPRVKLVDVINNVCPGNEIEMAVRDSFQDSMSLAIWDFNDGTVIYDSIKPPLWKIKSQKHIYKTKGHWPITLTLQDMHGCSNFAYRFVDIGHYSSFSVKDTIICPGTPVQFLDDVWYWSNVGQFTYSDTEYLWKQTARPEKLYWYFGDGDSATGSRPLHVYKKPGNYKPYLISVDSVGCIDTFYAGFGLHILGFHANFYKKKDKYLCGEFVQLFDSSYTTSDSSFKRPGDTAIWWEWDFGDGKRKSNLQNPYHNYSSFGWFNVKLKSRNSEGCEDSIVQKIYVKGPLPSFQIASDSIGCTPLTVRFRNTSVDTTCSRYIWLMGDPNNTIISTTSDSDIVFTYSKPGRYEIYLFGEDSIYNPDTKNKYYCSSIYPDTNYMMKKVVIVQPYLNADFAIPDTVCPHQIFNLMDKSDTGYSFYRVNWGDSTYDSATTTSIPHAFHRSGTYTIHYMPGYIPPPLYDTCYRDKTRTIYVSDIIADFDYDDTQMGETGDLQTKQKSTYAVRYEWDFGNPKQGSYNTSTEISPLHNYAGDTGIYNICLKAYNQQGCWDTICKPVHSFLIHHLIIPNVFTANGDTINDAFDIDIEGEEYYKLYIYNRWGELVFIGNEDGEGNDNKNWNGRVFNTGGECSEGTYYWVLDCRFKGVKKNEHRKGFLTLLR